MRIDMDNQKTKAAGRGRSERGVGTYGTNDYQVTPSKGRQEIISTIFLIIV